MINPFNIGNPIEFDRIINDRTKSVYLDGFTGTHEALERDVVIRSLLEVLGYGL
jgi:hypothetical protein